MGPFMGWECWDYIRVRTRGQKDRSRLRVRHQKNGLLSYIIFPNYLSYFFVMPRASVARRRVLTNDGPCYLSLVHSRLVTHVLVTRPIPLSLRPLPSVPSCRERRER